MLKRNYKQQQIWGQKKKKQQQTHAQNNIFSHNQQSFHRQSNQKNQINNINAKSVQIPILIQAINSAKMNKSQQTLLTQDRQLKIKTYTNLNKQSMKIESQSQQINQSLNPSSELPISQESKISYSRQKNTRRIKSRKHYDKQLKQQRCQFFYQDRLDYQTNQLLKCYEDFHQLFSIQLSKELGLMASNQQTKVNKKYLQQNIKQSINGKCQKNISDTNNQRKIIKLCHQPKKINSYLKNHNKLNHQLSFNHQQSLIQSFNLPKQYKNQLDYENSPQDCNNLLRYSQINDDKVKKKEKKQRNKQNLSKYRTPVRAIYLKNNDDQLKKKDKTDNKNKYQQSMINSKVSQNKSLQHKRSNYIFVCSSKAQKTNQKTKKYLPLLISHELSNSCNKFSVNQTSLKIKQTKQARKKQLKKINNQLNSIQKLIHSFSQSQNKKNPQTMKKSKLTIVSNNNKKADNMRKLKTNNSQNIKFQQQVRFNISQRQVNQVRNQTSRNTRNRKGLSLSHSLKSMSQSANKALKFSVVHNYLISNQNNDSPSVIKNKSDNMDRVVLSNSQYICIGGSSNSKLKDHQYDNKDNIKSIENLNNKQTSSIISKVVKDEKIDLINKRHPSRRVQIKIY